MPGANCKPLRLLRVPRTPSLYHILIAGANCWPLRDFRVPRTPVLCHILPELRQAEAEDG
eukprot:9094473-Pyramimonas_sp.AAC.1